MSLSDLIRGKIVPVRVATATPATFATQDIERGRTVATVATVAVAKPKEEKTAPPPEAGAGDTATLAVLPFTPNIRRPSAPMTGEEQKAIRAWLALIEETDPSTIAEVIGQCQRDADARDYYTGRAAAEAGRADDRIGKMLAKLEGDPGLRYATEVHDEIDPDAVILTLAIRGEAACELRIPKSRYDGVVLLELIEKHTTRRTLQ